MKLRSILIASLLLASIASAEQVTTYSIAHTRYRDSNMVIVISNANFFEQSDETQERWFTALKVCSRNANLAGQVIVVANVNRRLRFYGPKSWHSFLRTIDMAWVRARVNKELTCHY
jgi:hypothetical protein